MLRGLATVSFFAADLAEAAAWYTKVLGVEPYFAFPHYLAVLGRLHNAYLT